MRDQDQVNIPRRSMLKVGAVAAFGSAMAALAARTNGRSASAASSLVASPYGPVAPVNDLSTGLPLIELPAGFSYKSHGWQGDVMADGLVTPGKHDGMGVAATRRLGRSTEMILVRNHEQGGSTDAGRIIGAGHAGVAKYDVGTTGGHHCTGGTSNLVFRDGDWVGSYSSFGGTYANCSGGVSSWGSWLSNEEICSNAVSNTGKKHGYVFEVPADTSLNAANTEPIADMGRFAHEACALDTDTGYWYLTEDQSHANTLYRFRPHNANGGLGSLHAGGELQGLKVRGVAHADLRNPVLGQEYVCEWVAIADPDLDGGRHETAIGQRPASGPFLQAHANGAAFFGASEGCWVARGVVYFTDKQITSRPARAGRIWALDLASMTLKAIFVSDDIQVGNAPDCVVISPRGGVLFCEDGSGVGPNSGDAVVQQRLMVVHPGGGSYVFARNNFNFTRAQLAAAGKSEASAGDHRNTEWCGATFSGDGQVLFANLQKPGVTLAISGPWDAGTL